MDEGSQVDEVVQGSGVKVLRAMQEFRMQASGIGPLVDKMRVLDRLCKIWERKQVELMEKTGLGKR